MARSPDLGRVTGEDRPADGPIPAPAHVAPEVFWTRCSVSSAAGHPCARADSMPESRLRVSEVLSFHASVTAAKIPALVPLASDGDSADGFKGSHCETPVGCRFDTLLASQRDGAGLGSGPGGPRSRRGVPDRD